MSENQNVQIPEVPVAAGPTQEQLDIQEAMRFAFQDEMPQVSPESPTESTLQPPATEPTEQLIVEQPAPLQETIVDDSVYLRDNFNVESRDALKSILEEYNQLKSKATTPAEYQFANEESKRIAHAINSGDYKTLRTYIEAQELNLEGMSDEQVLKQYIKYQNPNFSQKHIEEEYAEMYGLNEEDIDESRLEREKLKLENRKMADVAKAKETFAQYKTKAQLPDIQVQQAPDPDYEAYKASTAKNAEVYEKEIAPALNALKESDLQMNISVLDKENQMDFGVGIQPDANDFQASRDFALNIPELLNRVGYDERGNFSPTKLASFILKGLYFDKYAPSIARQAVNAERKRVLEVNTPSPAVQRSFDAPVEETEIQKQYRMAMSV